VNVCVGVDVYVAVGLDVLVGEGVHVGRGVRVGVFVQMMGVRVDVGVADNAATNNCRSAVCVAAVACMRRSGVAVEEGAMVVGCAVSVTAGGEVYVEETVAGGDGV
jgi:hypothetical protein